MPNKVQALITEIERVQKTRKTMLKRLHREGDVINKAKKTLRAIGIRPYHKKRKKVVAKQQNKISKTPEKSPEKIPQKDISILQ